LKNGVGFQASIGLKVKISNKIQGHIEISAYSLSIDRIKYEGINRQRLVSNQPTGDLLPILEKEDFSRIIIKYEKEGLNTFIRSGTADKYVYTYTYPQDQMNINTITAAVVITFSF
jgi:hypothetical protein